MGFFSKAAGVFKHGMSGKLGNIINSRNLANVLPIASIYTTKGRSELLNNSIWVKYGKGIAAGYTGGASSAALAAAQGYVNGPEPVPGNGGGGGPGGGGGETGGAFTSPAGGDGSSSPGMLAVLAGGAALVLVFVVALLRRKKSHG